MTTFPKILFAGKKRSGKTSSTNYLKQKIPGTISLTFAEPLKAACKALFLLSDSQLYDEAEKEKEDPRWGVSPRKLFQKVGDLLRYGLQLVLPEIKLDHGLIFTENMYWRLQTIENQHITPTPPLLIIEDGRLADEHNFFKSLGRTLSIRIDRNTDSTDQHSSEKINFQCDLNIVNNGTLDELYSQLNQSLHKLQITAAESSHSSPNCNEEKKISRQPERQIVWRGDAISDMPYAEYYKNTFILNETQINLFRHRFDSVSAQRRQLHKPCRAEYNPIENQGFAVAFYEQPGFNYTHFNCSQWIFRPLYLFTDAVEYQFKEPCVLFVFKWSNTWQHFMQDLVPVLVTAKPYLDRHPNYRLIVLKGTDIKLIRDLLGIVNPISEVELDYRFRAISQTLITFESQDSSEPANMVSNIRKMEYYSQANHIIRESIRKHFPEVETSSSSSPYILYLSRKNLARCLRQDEEIRNLDPRIRVFNLEEQDVQLWDRFKLFYNASMIIAPHGGAIYHVLACKPNIPLIEIFGAGDFINCERMINGIPLQYFPLMSTNLKSHYSSELYDIDVSLIKQIIDFALPQ